jgi:hypothetical protein
MRMSLVRGLFALSASAVLVGCAPTIRVRSVGEEARLPVSTRDTICVAHATDGRFGTRRYAGSGDVVSERIVEALRSRYPSVKLLLLTDEDDAVGACRAKHGRCLIVPTIAHWEDRYTGWSWKKDRIEIRLRLRSLDDDATRREVVYVANTSGGMVAREVLLTGWTNEPPEELLTDCFDAAVLGLVSGASAEHSATTAR